MKQNDVFCEVHFCTAPVCSEAFKARCALRKAYLSITPSLIEYSLDQIHQMGFLTIREFAVMRRLSLTSVRRQADTGIYITKKFTIKFGTRKKPGQTLCIKHPDFSPSDAPPIYTKTPNHQIVKTSKPYNSKTPKPNAINPNTLLFQHFTNFSPN